LAVDMRALGRVADPLAGSPRRRRHVKLTRRHGTAIVRRRPLVPRRVLGSLAVSLVLLLWVGMSAQRQVGDEAAITSLPAAPAAPTDAVQLSGTGIFDVPARPGDGRASRDGAMRMSPQSTFAVVDDLRLALPHPSPILVAFHEASRPEALPLDPVGHLVANDNPTKFTPGDDVFGPGYAVLSSRGRPRPATSAADIVVPSGSLVSAPVSGKVVEVREYVLYQRVRDWRVVIEPAGRPDLHVVLIHLHKPRVAPGDLVQAEATELAAARALPFLSHVDYVLDERHSHVHIEVKAAVAVAPLDPNAPALPADAHPDFSS
jgi:hypothetical protein